MAGGVNEPPHNQVRTDRTHEPDEAPNGAVRVPDASPPPGKRPEEFHRPPTRLEKFRNWVEGLPHQRFYVLLLFFTWLSLTVLISLDPRPSLSTGWLPGGGQDYEVGSVARDDVYAQRGVSYVDPVATEAAREEARDEAPMAYRQDPGITIRQVEAAEGFFDEVRDIRASGDAPGEKVSRVVGVAPFPLPENVARSLVFLDGGQVDEAERYAIENLEDLYGTTAVGDDGAEGPSSGFMPLSEGRERLSEAASRDASGELAVVVDVVSGGFLAPNYIVDREATESARDEAAAEVDDVSGRVGQGERVIAAGEVLDRGDVARLRALGLTGGANPLSVFLGVGIVVATEMWIAWYFLERFGKRILKGKAIIRVLLASLLLILFTALARAFVLLSLPSYLIPLAGLSILGTILLGPRLMFLMVVIESVNIGIIGGNDFFLASVLLLTSGFAIYTVLRVGPRTEFLWAGLLIAVVTGIVMFAFALIGGGGLRGAFGQGGIGLVNGLLSLMLAMVLLPLLENAFNILTPQKMLELADTGNPLLHKLLSGAPGTFTHSIQVGSLAANAAERIGADPLLARVGAYYHDVGKLEHPYYFIENQIGRANPHKSLTPALSARIIKRHVKDGLRIGREWNLPQEVLDMIAQHHGTTRIEYFYRRALEDSLGGDLAGVDVREADFRYPGPKPKSKEAGILMLADSIEATVKSLDKPTPKRIEDIVGGTIRGKLEDGQFDECQLTMNEIHETGEAIREALIGFIGPRIEYPQQSAPKPAPAQGSTA
ncbi:MAG: Membrane protein containing HD superfamily hydrolase domain, YQFF ortholog [uncultured Rubrobacteraceae bacterium]|uniref:Membrane protein containing HD superfamily hydrolase domain, YQFF ortholog n=1 Tax=uncultured Rubrobacteraceae bacterium TaxID=349277 RepID=A0A6J4SHT3_9ACTN|nr:MAG: Membrane protein containing HD superfamily hydrolase domain, YQFF ortholog [uncultured Rubrobacteraceae bacterium]